MTQKRMTSSVLQRKDYPTHLYSCLATTLHTLPELALEGEEMSEGYPLGVMADLETG